MRFATAGSVTRWRPREIHIPKAAHDSGQALSLKLLQAAVAYAISRGAKVVEGYPVEPRASYRFMGSPSIFEKAGFQEAVIADNGRRIMRFVASRGQRQTRKGAAASESKRPRR